MKYNLELGDTYDDGVVSYRKFCETAVECGGSFSEIDIALKVNDEGVCGAIADELYLKLFKGAATFSITVVDNCTKWLKDHPKELYDDFGEVRAFGSDYRDDIDEDLELSDEELEETLTNFTKNLTNPNLCGIIEVEDQPDMVNNPHHYTARGGIQPHVYAMSNDFNALEYLINKYLNRYPFKGNPVQDLEKIDFYLKELIKVTREKEAKLEKEENK